PITPPVPRLGDRPVGHHLPPSAFYGGDGRAPRSAPGLEAGRTAGGDDPPLRLDIVPTGPTRSRSARHRLPRLADPGGPRGKRNNGEPERAECGAARPPAR